MEERDQINAIVGIISHTPSGRKMGNELIRIYDNLLSESAKHNENIQNCRDYLMQVDSSELKVGDTLEALGFTRKGLRL